MDVIDGSPSDSTYLVRYDEDDWHALPEETKKYCLDYWRRKAETAGTPYLVLMLVPDPIFPSSDTTLPYVYISRKVADNVAFEKIDVTTEVVFTARTKPIGRADVADHLRKYYQGVRGRITYTVIDNQGNMAISGIWQ